MRHERSSYRLYAVLATLLVLVVAAGAVALLDLTAPLPFARKEFVLGKLRELQGTVRYLPASHPDNKLNRRVLVATVQLPFLSDPGEFEALIKPSLPASSEAHQRVGRSFTGMTVLPTGDGQIRFAVDFVERTDFRVPQVKASTEAVVGAVVAGPVGAVVGGVIGRLRGKETSVSMQRGSLARGSVQFTVRLRPRPVNGRDVAVRIAYEHTKDCSGFGAHIKDCDREIDKAVAAAEKPACIGFELPSPDPAFALIESRFVDRGDAPGLQLTYALSGWRGVLAPYVLAFRGIPAPAESGDEKLAARSVSREDPCLIERGR